MIRQLRPRDWWLIGSGTVVVLLAITYWDARRDIAPPDNSDIPVYEIPTNIPDEENGFVLLHRIGESIDDVEYKQNIDIHQLFDPGLYLKEKKNLEPKWQEIGPYFHQVEPLLAPVDQALQAPHFADLWTRKRSDESRADLATVMSVMRSLLYRARWFAHQSKWNAAWQDQLRLFQISANLCGGETYVLGTMVGTSGYDSGCEFILQHLLPFTPHANATLERTEQLRQFQLDPRDLKKQLLLENEGKTLAEFVELGHSLFEKNTYLDPIFYKPNATFSLHLELFREALTNAKRLPIEMRFSVQDHLNSNPPWLLNYRGHEILQLNQFDETIYRFHAATAFLMVTRVGLALAGYTQEHGGALPAKLKELVPRYLSDLPLDPMDGLPLRYDPAKRKVWSIGRNLVDNMGKPIEPVHGLSDTTGDLVAEIPSI